MRQGDALTKSGEHAQHRHNGNPSIKAKAQKHKCFHIYNSLEGANITN